MRHRQKTKNLSRFSSHYKATMNSLVQAMIKNQRIVTTQLKAKLGRSYVDKIITLGKKSDSLAARRRAFAVLKDHALVQRLFNDVAPMFAKKNGGYTRIIPYKKRRGDNAQLAILELSIIKEALKKEPKGKKEVESKEQEFVKDQLKKRPKAAGEDKHAAPPEGSKHKKDAKKPKKKLIGGLGKIFKQERDSL